MFMLAGLCFAGIVRGPLLSAETPHEAMIVNFRTANPCVGQVKFRETGTTDWRFASDSKSSTDHAIEIALPAYSNIEYVLLADSDSIGPHFFWTAPEPGVMKDFQFCSYGDSRDWHIAHAVIIEHIISCDPMFVTHSGDMVGDGNDIGDWDTYFELLSEDYDIARTAPFFYAMGNHDRESDYFYDAVRLPQNPSGTEEYGSFDWGRIHFFFMNSEIDYSITSDQYEFLSNDLADASANPDYDFLIGLVHRPFYSSGYHGREENMAISLEPLLVANNVDLVLQGHDHIYERSHPQDGVIYIVTGGGGAPSSTIFWWLSHCAFGYNFFHHLNFRYVAEEHKLSMFMHNYDNDIVDSLILINTPIAVQDQSLPHKHKISAHPNPFNSYCRICRPPSWEGEQDIEIYDVTGSLVRKERLGQKCCFLWWGKDDSGADLPSGVYLAKFVPGTENAIKLTIIK